MSLRQLYSWRRQLAAGTLDIGVMLRENIPMSDESSAEFSRLTQRNQELQALNAQLETRIAELEKAVADKDAATTERVKVMEAMEKAIAAMQKHTGR